MKVSWHCPECEYLHIADSPKSIDGFGIVTIKCIVCKRETRLSPDDLNKTWRREH